MKIRTSITTNRDCSCGRTNGFTVAELMVVVVVIVLLASAMGGYYVGTYKKMLVETAAKEIMLAAKYARLFAVEKQSSCRLMVDEKEKSFCLMTGRAYENATEASETVVSNSYTKPGLLKGDVMFEKVEVVPSAEMDTQGRQEQSIIVFRRDGTADTAVIQVGDDKHHYTVYISAATGKAKVEFGPAGEAAIDIVDLDAETY